MGFHVISKDLTDSPISIDAYLLRDRASSYLLRVEGDAMEHAAIRAGDLVLVETSAAPRDNALVVACYRGQFLLRRYTVQKHKITLIAEHPNFPPIEIVADDDFTIFGVVTGVIRKLRA